MTFSIADATWRGRPHKLLSLCLACLLAGVPGVAQTAPRVNFDNSARLHDLLRAGNLYLSVQDALALAIENNLDIELQRFNLPVADAELLRTKGGGLTRGLNYTLS